MEPIPKLDLVEEVKIASLDDLTEPTLKMMPSSSSMRKKTKVL
jgi:hypothetical protein